MNKKVINFLPMVFIFLVISLTPFALKSWQTGDWTMLFTGIGILTVIYSITGLIVYIALRGKK